MRALKIHIRPTIAKDLPAGRREREQNVTLSLICYRLSAIGVVISVLALASPVLANFGMPVLGRSTGLGDLTLTGVFPRIFTPNGDGANDKVGFHFSNPEDLPVQGEIFDLSGARVADLKPGSDPASLLLWDGKDSDGRTVPGGIYLYQIVFQGKTATGSVVVAR